MGAKELDPVASNPTHFCSEVEFNQTNFHSFADIQVVINPTWNNFNASPNNIIHGATGTWVESINGTHFRACCKTTFVEEHAGDKCSINYFVYQKNLKYQTEGKMVAGEPVVLPDFATSSGCGNVTDVLVSVSVVCLPLFVHLARSQIKWSKYCLWLPGQPNLTEVTGRTKKFDIVI